MLLWNIRTKLVCNTYVVYEPCIVEANFLLTRYDRVQHENLVANGVTAPSRQQNIPKLQWFLTHQLLQWFLRQWEARAGMRHHARLEPSPLTVGGRFMPRDATYSPTRLGICGPDAPSSSRHHHDWVPLRPLPSGTESKLDAHEILTTI
jgi:hypothetical protein